MGRSSSGSLGRKLKTLRVNCGKQVADVANAQIASRSKLFKIEAGSVPVKMADVRALCWLYGADAETTDALAELALNTAADGWWEEYADAVPRWFTTYIELEGAATSILRYDPELVPGLLQTVGYHQAVFAKQPDLTDESAERQIALRLGRQRAAFDRQQPLQLTAVIAEGALMRDVGGAEVMAEQRRYLLQHHAQILVLASSAGAHAAVKGGFVILDFADQDDPSVVYQETLTGARYTAGESAVSICRRVFSSVVHDSVPIKEFLS